jgi:hypothetical protein
MSDPSRLVPLCEAYRRLLDEFHVYRLLPTPTVKDVDRLVGQYDEATRLALLGGLPTPPPLAQAGLTVYNPLLCPPPRRDPDAGRAWEAQVQAQLRDAEARLPDAEGEAGRAAGPDEAHPCGPAEDLSAYRPASEFLDPKIPTYKVLHAVLKAHPWIRNYKPSQQRLEVHAGDMHRFRKWLDEACFEALDVAAATEDQFMAEVHQRLEQIKSRKAGK